MGCWDETCGISRMTIHSGEPVRFLPIVQNPWHYQKQLGFPNGEAPELLKGESGVYMSDLWVPFCLPIRGEYNDYGTIENIPEKTETDEAELAQFVDAFKKMCIPLEVGENSCHDVAIKDFTIDEILDALREGRTYTKFRGGGKELILPISWMMIKESVWQSLLAIDIFKTDDGSFYKMCYLKDGRKDTITLNGIRTELKRVFGLKKNNDVLEAKYKALDKSDTDGLYDVTKQLLAAMRELDIVNNSFQSHVWHHAPFEYRPELTEHILETYAEMEYVSSIMGCLRINYAPTCGSGSQCPNQKTWKLVFTSWKKIADKDQHHWDE